MTPEESDRRIGALESQVRQVNMTIQSLQAPRPALPAQSSPTILGVLPTKLKDIMKLGFEWVANQVNVKAGAGIIVDASGVSVKVKSNSGLAVGASGLAVVLEANKGLSMGAAGLATLLKTKGGVLAGATGLYLDLLLGVVTPLTPGAIVPVDFSLGCGFTLTPGEDETLNASNGTPGQRATLIITTSGTTSWNLTFGTHFKTQGVLATGTVNAKIFAMGFWTPDGITWYEETRTGAM